MTQRIIFNLKRYWNDEATRITINLYEAIKQGKKTSEWRRFTKHWQQRLLLCTELKALSKNPIDCTDVLKARKAWFVVGFPKNNLPRLEADITSLIYHPITQMFEIKFGNVLEVLE